MKVEDIVDTEFLPEEVVDKCKFRAENQRVVEAGGRPAQGRAVLLGITKASLSTDSFISAAYYRQVKIAGEDVVEEPVVEPSLEPIPGYDEETRLQFTPTPGMSEDSGEESLAE